MESKHVVRLYERDLMQLAQSYNLNDPEERLRSVADLENLFFRMARFVQPSVFIEAGAMDAKVSRRARRCLPDARIVAFEANPYNYAVFKDAEFIESSEIEYIHAALSDKSGELPFSLRRSFKGQRLDRVQGEGSIKAYSGDDIQFETVNVTSMKLDDFFGTEHPQTTFLWIDVEGALDQVLIGGRIFFENVTGAILVEVEDRELWQDQWLSSEVHSYMLAHNFIPCARDFQSRYQYNVIYLHEELLKVDYINFCLTMHKSYATMGMIEAINDA